MAAEQNLFQVPSRSSRWFKWSIRSFIVIAIIAATLTGLYFIISEYYIFRWNLVWSHLPKINEGLVITLQASVIGAVLGLSIGLIVALMRLSPLALLRDMGMLYVHSLRNVPFIVFVLFMYFGVSRALMPRGYNVILLGWDIDDRLFWGALALGLFEASFIAEIFRAGIQAIHKTQIEASRSLGMSYTQSMRYIVLPQAFRIIIPPMTGELIALIKESALLLAISLPELTLTVKQLSSSRPVQFEFYTILAAYYLAITVPISFLSFLFEHHYERTMSFFTFQWLRKKHKEDLQESAA
jgi:polar amino acid transport system permease protein